ncbi:T9SS type A sorting domain-containing protein, partial [Candidatus Bipolaricaulota bacterium]|nr:T9SS type A sorting domain-containing protein [Candidatus Bipolaricaulota bacterium]
YTCVPTLAVLPGDTIVAFYQDPSNHSDSAMISIKVGLGGGGTPPSQASTTMFTDADGNEVTSYTDADDVYVKVIDPSKAGAAEILDAVDISGTTYDLAPLAGAATDTFITGPISGLGVGTFTATYTDPTDPTDTSSDEIDIIASELSVDNFYAGPNPFDTEVTFGYNGTGIATTFSVTVYDLSGHQVWTDEQANVDHITWDGSGLANGGYIYVVMATDGENTFTGKGTVFINK